MKYKVFIDGQEGTTGLRIFEDLSKRSDIEVLRIDSDKRKNTEERSKFLNKADIVFLCLPDSAARESIELVKNGKTRIINASTAFRTDKNWIYGLPELKNQRELIRSAPAVSVPGCHATGFILTIRPLIEAGILPKDYPITCYSVTGYFTPIIANYAQGLAMSVPLISRILPKNSLARDVHEVLSTYFESERFVRVMPCDSEAYLDEGHFLITERNNTNRLEIFVFGQNDKITIISRYDNLGKGASGAAIQNMNLMLGFDEANSLVN